MTPNVHHTYDIGVPRAGRYQEILNSDKSIYHGSNQFNGTQLYTKKGERNGFKYYIQPKIGPFAGVILNFKK